MANDRDCENCVHKVNGACTVWDCKFEPKRGMTREEAKALLLNISAYDIDTQRGMKKQEAIEMAIKALEQVPCDKCVYSTSEGCQYDDITETIPPFETSDDAISRQAVLEQAMDYGSNTYLIPVNSVKALPPVTPQPKMGRWIYTGDYITEGMLKCSECGFEHDVSERFSFCPECGAKMVEPQAESEK